MIRLCIVFNDSIGWSVSCFLMSSSIIPVEVNAIVNFSFSDEQIKGLCPRLYENVVEHHHKLDEDESWKAAASNIPQN